ncbi:mucin-binding protein [Limosilactobacillus fermentum]
MSGTTGSQSSYSTSGSIADYKKQGYEVGPLDWPIPAHLMFHNDDTTDQNFTVHLKHRVNASESNGSTDTWNANQSRRTRWTKVAN